MSQRWRPYIVVAGIVEKDGRFLLVEEREEDGQITLNQPGGLLEAGESLIDAVAREVLEESGLEFFPEAFLGTYHLSYRFADGEDVSYVRFAFTGSVGEQRIRELDPDIVRTHWMTKEELLSCLDRHRSVVVMQCVEDYLAGQKYPLSAVSRYTAKDL